MVRRAHHGRGFVDVVVHSASKIFVMEFKKDKTHEIAMRQILTKKYYEKYATSGKTLVLAGINFDIEEEGVEVS